MKLIKEDYIKHVLILHHCLCYHEEDDSFFDVLEQLEQLIDEYFELKNKYEHIETERSMFKRELSIMSAALVKACKLLKKAGVVYGKENGKPVRLGKDAWFEKLVNAATKEMELEGE